MKVNIHSPENITVQKISNLVKNCKQKKTANVGESGLPGEMPLDSYKDKRAAAMLNDSFNYNRAKDAVTIMSGKFLKK